jgi:two-component system phosphate regulon sensor histidine kinase PhoR
VRAIQLSRHAAREAARAETAGVAELLLERFSSGLMELARRSLPPLPYSEAIVPAPANQGQELFRVALTVPGEEAAERLRSLEENHRDALAESGVPLLPLIAWTQLRNASTAADSQLLAEKLGRVAVETHPSMLTPELLDRAADLLIDRAGDAEPIERWRRRWRQDELARAVLRNSAERLLSLRTPLWVEGGAQTWWVEPDDNGHARALTPKSHLTSLAETVIRRDGASLPAYASVVIALGGAPLTQSPLHGTELARTARGGVAVSGLLTDPAKLYGQQLAQTFWLAALLVCALTAALAGFWTMRRSLFRERQLGALKSNFVASVSHELRAPIASMRVMAENLETGVVRDGARQKQYHRLISEECRRLATLIDNVLDFARIEQDRKTYRFAETDVAALVGDAIRLIEPRALQRGQTIRSDVVIIDPPPVTDGLAVQQALINLLDNAIKFSPEGATITVQLCEAGNDDWELSVSDSGPGIERAEHARIFERFYRIGSELCRETHGTGIGLSIVKHIVEGHEGEIKIESAPNAGARFILLFPRVPGAAKQAS